MPYTVIPPGRQAGPLICLATALALLSAACGPAPNLPREGTGENLAPARHESVPTQTELEALFRAELARLGIDPDKVVAAAPGPGNEVFDLSAVPAEGGGVILSWTERLRGDYDQNSEVNVNDLTPLGAYMLAQVLYDPPALHAGFPAWPSGNPLDTGGAAAGEPPPPGSGAYNWRLARVDGSGDGEVNISDMTPLGAGLGQRLDGYCVYRRGPAEPEWVRLPNVLEPELQYTVKHPQAQVNRPVRYSLVDPVGMAGAEYRVSAFDSASAAEGPSSAAVTVSGGPGAEAPTAVLTADPLSGNVPLTCTFDAAGSFSPGGALVLYELDFEGDGSFELVQAAPIANAQHVYTASGKYQPRLRVTDIQGLTGIASVDIAAGRTPTASLVATPDSGEVPLTVKLDASGSLDPDGDVLVYDWDLDGNGSFEYSSGLQAVLDVELQDAAQTNVAVQATTLIGLTAETTASLTLTDDYDEQEPNETAAEATAMGSLELSAPITGFRGSIGSPGYSGGLTDWISFDTAAGLSLTIAVAYPQAGGGLSLRLFDAADKVVVASGVHSPGLETISLNVVKAAQYRLRVQAADPSDAPPLDYTVSILPTALVLDDTEPNDTALTPQLLLTAGEPPGALPPGEYVFYGQLSPGDADDWWQWVIPTRLSFFYELDVRLEFSHSLADLDLQILRPDGQGELKIVGSSLGTLDEEQAAPTFPPLDFDGNPDVFIHLRNFSGGTAYYAMHIRVSVP
jgi:PKD repeat protein